jgi:hypothetical protein
MENESEEKEVYTDQEINELIARSEEEQVAFDEMDQERNDTIYG